MRISKRSIDAIEAPAKDTFFWDETLKGFGVKGTKTGKKMFVLQGRLDGIVRRYTIGQYGSPWSPDQARRRQYNSYPNSAVALIPLPRRRPVGHKV